MAWEGALLPEGRPAYTPARNDATWTHAHWLIKRQQRPPGCEIVDIKEQGSSNDREHILIWNVPWTSYEAFKQWAVGYSYVGLSAHGAVAIRRTIPDQHPRNPKLYASRYSLLSCGGASFYDDQSFALGVGGFLINAQGQPVQVGDPAAARTEALAWADNRGDHHREGKAQVEVAYTPRPYQIRTDDEIDNSPPAFRQIGEGARFLEIKQDYSVQGVPINRVVGARLRFDPGTPYAGTPIPEAGVLLMPQSQVEIIHYDVPDVPKAAIDVCRGKINALAVGGVSGMPLFPIGTLLYQSSTYERKDGVNMRPCFTIRHTFAERVAEDPTNQFIGWNVFPAADGNFYPAHLTDNVHGDPNGNTIYQFEDMNILFQPLQGAAVVYQ